MQGPEFLGKWTTALALAGAAALGCSGGSDEPAGGPLGPGNGPGTQSAACADGDTLPCGIELGEHNGVVSCFEGTRVCGDGKWGPCQQGTVTTKAAWGVATASLSLPEACLDAPCDPTCQIFDEVPGGSITADPQSDLPWSTGDPSNPPAGTVNEPCSWGADCQANHFCQDPVSGSCGHSKCAEGAALAPGCDPCVDAICAAMPSCCEPQTGCDSLFGTAPGYIDCGGTATECSLNMNATTSSCDDVCQAAGQTCVGAWDNAGVCGIDTNLPVGCDASGDSSIICVCDRPAGGAWSSDCVDAVHTQCGAFCSSDQPPEEDGTCVHWIPGQTDSHCSGIDLTVDTPCDGSVPVCNVGQTTAPAGIQIAHFPPGSGQLGSCEPDLNLSTGGCVTTEEIPPGECIDLTSCIGLVDGSEILVNPPGPGAQNECTPGACLNNWSVYQAGDCQAPECSGPVSRDRFQPVNLYVLVDKSGSMGSSGMWTPAMNAMKAFVQDPGSAGLNVALRFYPDDLPVAGCSSDACDPVACQAPLVPLGALTADPGPTDTHEQALVDAIDSRIPGGGTPTKTALEGATQWAMDYSVSHPDEQQVVVLISDGAPTQCDTSYAAIAAEAQEAFDQHGVLTYAIGLDGADQTLMNQVAAAGGTGSAFFVSNNNNVEQQLLAALQAISGEPVSCAIDLPPAGLFDPQGAVVSYLPDGGSPVILPQLPSVGACGSGWHYDDPNDPTQVLLCPDTCIAVQAGAEEVSVELTCPADYEATEYTQVYLADCPTGTSVQWGFAAYATTAPLDTAVFFEVRTAATEGELDGVSWLTAATAESSPSDTQLCSLAGPAPCPLDLWNILGGAPLVHHDVLELKATFVPGGPNDTVTPSLHNWQVTYSCPDSQ